jgi:hypothetical protein
MQAMKLRRIVKNGALILVAIKVYTTFVTIF